MWWEGDGGRADCVCMDNVAQRSMGEERTEEGENAKDDDADEHPPTQMCRSAGGSPHCMSLLPAGRSGVTLLLIVGHLHAHRHPQRSIAHHFLLHTGRSGGHPTPGRWVPHPLHACTHDGPVGVGSA